MAETGENTGTVGGPARPVAEEGEFVDDKTDPSISIEVLEAMAALHQAQTAAHRRVSDITEILVKRNSTLLPPKQ